MNCRECQDLVQRYLDGDPDVLGPALDRHLSVCPSCRMLHAAAQRLCEGLRFVPFSVPPRDLAPRIVVRVLRQRRQRRRRLWTVTAVAASLLLVIGTGYLGRRPSASSVGALPVVQVETPAAASLHQRVEEVGLAVVALTRRTADETVSQTRFFFPAVGLLPTATDTAPRSETLLDPPVQSLREVGQGVSAGLEPVTASARRAVNRFLQDLPPMQ
jgi:hypothetical protein